MGHYDTSYRIAKDRDESERIVEKIYNREIDEEGFRWRTRPLYPYVAAVYGWETRQHKLDKADQMLSTKYGRTQNRHLL